MTYLIHCKKIGPTLVFSELAPIILENAEVLKIMHSATSNDVGWLQRDFGVQLVNVFDVQHTHGQTVSLAELWTQYCQND